MNVLKLPSGVTTAPQAVSDIVGMPASLTPIAFQLDFVGALRLGFMVIFALVFVDLFDSMGTMMGTGARAGFLDKDGCLPKVKQAMVVDALGTAGGALLVTSTVTTYVESTARIAQGGRTSLTAVVTGLLFLLALFFTPLAAIVPAAATAPALVIVGVLMMGAVTGMILKILQRLFQPF
ncbi:MAG: Adenine permease AdeQ [Syntrophomonadaceae bacterium]|nr:Adenine permease AdeQ [Bacillota bacterium]